MSLKLYGMDSDEKFAPQTYISFFHFFCPPSAFAPPSFVVITVCLKPQCFWWSAYHKKQGLFCQKLLLGTVQALKQVFLTEPERVASSPPCPPPCCCIIRTGYLTGNIYSGHSKVLQPKAPCGPKSLFHDDHGTKITCKAVDRTPPTWQTFIINLSFVDF